MTKTFQELYPHHQDTTKKVPFWKRIFRVVYDAGRGFIEDDCYAKASALTYYSLLSVVPIFAVLFGIAKGFGFEKALETEIKSQFADQRELMEKLIEFAYSWLQNVQGGILAGVGVVVLFWSVLGLLNNVENALNAIWKTPISRTYSRKISDYLSTLLICPVFFVTSSSITLYLSTRIAESAHSNLLTEAISPVLLFVLKLFPFFLSIVLFTFIYLFMPNTKVYLRSALIAGIVGGIAFQLWQWIYFQFQIYASSYGAIYGSFAALPLFLVWLQVSWLILLAGAELAFEIENDLFVPFRHLVSLSAKAAALLISFRCVEAFAEGKSPPTDRSLAHELGMSLNHIHILLEALEKDRIVSMATTHGRTIGYQPARAIATISCSDVCHALDKDNDILASVSESQVLANIQRYLQETNKKLTEDPMNQPILTLKNSD